eukprot:3472394-Prymnesium_polylepis.1
MPNHVEDDFIAAARIKLMLVCHRPLAAFPAPVLTENGVSERALLLSQLSSEAPSPSSSSRLRATTGVRPCVAT